MPYPNEHAARVRNPDSFEPDTFRSKELKDGIRLILGKLKGGNGSMVVQAYRFSVDKFTVEQVKKWLEDNKIKYISFEPAQPVSETGGNMEDKLKHSGVLGMKWGVRRGSSKAGGREDKKWAKSVTNNIRRKVDVYNSAAARMNATEIKRINNKPEYKGKNLLKNKALQEKYMKEYTEVFTKVLNEEASKKYGTSPSGTRKVRAGFNDYGLPIFEVNEIEHASNQVIYVATVDENGFITSISIKEDEISQTDLVEEYLHHSGVLGMKWGVRRRRAEAVGKTISIHSPLRGRMKPILGKKIARKSSEDFKVAAGLRKKQIDEMTNDEISRVNKRLDLEKRYKDLNPSKAERGRKGATKVLSTIGQVSAGVAGILYLSGLGGAFLKRVTGKAVVGAGGALGEFLK
jgi:hypothetical protein